VMERPKKRKKKKLPPRPWSSPAGRSKFDASEKKRKRGKRNRARRIDDQKAHRHPDWTISTRKPLEYEKRKVATASPGPCYLIKDNYTATQMPSYSFAPRPEPFYMQAARQSPGPVYFPHYTMLGKKKPPKYSMRFRTKMNTEKESEQKPGPIYQPSDWSLTRAPAYSMALSIPYRPSSKPNPSFSDTRKSRRKKRQPAFSMRPRTPDYSELQKAKLPGPQNYDALVAFKKGVASEAGRWTIGQKIVNMDDLMSMRIPGPDVYGPPVLDNSDICKRVRRKIARAKSARRLRGSKSRTEAGAARPQSALAGRI